MLAQTINSLRSEIKTYSKPERLFIVFMMLVSFAITGEASVTRATSESVFLSAYTAQFFPYVWLASVPLNFAIVSFYNHFLPRLGCVRMIRLSLIMATCINTFCAFYLSSLSFLPFMLYLWKDIFIILMFQQIWSVIHATIQVSRAKYLYGIFFGMGGIGSVVGSLIPGFLAVHLGSEKLLLTTTPFYLFVFCMYFLAMRIREQIPHKQDISNLNRDSTDILGGYRLIRKSNLLKLILIMVLAIQVAATLMNYQFSHMLEKMFTVQDIRTEFLGRFFGIVNTINIFLQFFGSFLLLKLIGIQASHFMVPFILASNVLAFIVWPSFRVMSLGFASIKSLDYSIFGIIKEMLYIPMKVEDKFKAKAVIDVFAYRSAKALASLLIVALGIFSSGYLEVFLSWAVLGIFIFWMGAIIFMFKYYHQEVDRQHLHWPSTS